MPRRSEEELLEQAQEIEKELVRSGAVLPLTIWSAAVRSIANGVEGRMGSSSEGHKSAPKLTYRDAVELYMDLSDDIGDVSPRDIVVVKPVRIVDARGAHVYPKP